MRFSQAFKQYFFVPFRMAIQPQRARGVGRRRRGESMYREGGHRASCQRMVERGIAPLVFVAAMALG